MPETVRVAVVNAIDPEAMAILRAVSDKATIIDAAELTRAERNGDSARAEELDAILASVDVVYALKLPERFVSRAPRVKWLQTISTGVDKILTPELVRSPIVVTNMSGIHEVTIAEFVLMLMLMFVKGAPRSFHQQIEGRFKWFPMDVLTGKTVGLVGFGRIGREVARVARCFDMKVVATRRGTAREESADGVDSMLPLSQLHELLGMSDFVVLALPLTDESRGLIGEAELRAMKPSARIINVSRGAIIDELALIQALRDGIVAGAGLDVFVQEPLPADSPLRRMENVIFSPHVSGDIAEYDVYAARLFAENLRRHLAEEPLLNLIDKARGY
jgi:phosphoglycerate dehydrogenase-like enzyme